MRMESMSSNIVNIMFELTKNEGLARLLVHDISNPFADNLPVIDRNKLIVPDSSVSKIFPYPFDPEVTDEDGSFIRIYYNDGEFDSSEAISTSQLNIDIIVSKSLWLIDNGESSLIRPYEIMGRVINMIGKRGLSKTIKLKFDGYQHLYINTKFDAIRLYGSYMSVESKYPDEKEYLDR